MRTPIENGELMLLIAALVSMLVRRLKIPYTVGLVVTGGLIAWVGLRLSLPLTKEVIFEAFLPPLVFEAAYQIPWQSLKRDWAPLSVFAVLGVCISAIVVAVGLRFLGHWVWPAAFLFAALISATDPVSVIALFRETGVTGRFRLIVESESLLNDGTAAVLFAVVLAIVTGGSMSASEVMGRFLLISFGGMGCGLAVGYVTSLLLRKADDHLLEITFSAIAAYGSFLLADHFELSGVLSTVAAGLVLGNLEHWEEGEKRARESLDAFWEFAAFVANSLIFLLIGIRIVKEDFSSEWHSLLIAIPLVIVGRAACVYISSAVVSRSSRKIPFSYQHSLVWGGLRGALSLALALSLPQDLPGASLILTTTYAVVAFSIIVQGMTVKPLMKRVGLI